MAGIRGLTVLAITVGAVGASRVQPGGTPDIHLPRTSVPFAPVLPDSVASANLAIRNLGAAVLTLGEITVDDPLFTVGGRSGGLPPGTTIDPSSTRNVEVSFRSAVVGPATGTLTIASDDPDEPSVAVELSATVVGPARLAITPPLVTATLGFQESEPQSLTIANVGASDLEWTMSILPRGDGSRGAALTGVRILWDRSHGQAPASVFATLIGDLEERGAAVEEVTAAGPGLADSLLFDYDVYCSLEPASAWAPEERAALDSWLRNGGSILLVGDRLESVPVFNELLDELDASIRYETAPGTADVVTTGVDAHPATEGVTGVYLGFGVRTLSFTDPAARLLRDTSGDPVAAVRARGAGRVAVFADEMFDESAVGRGDNRQLGGAVIAWLAQDSWLSADTLSSLVAPGESSGVVLTFDSAALTAGEYGQTVRVTSNDPASPTVDLPAHLVVTGVPDLALDLTRLDFGFATRGTRASRQVVVRNIGTEPLTVHAVSTSGGAFGAFPAALGVPAEDGRSITVTFAPDSVGAFSGELKLASDDPVEPTVAIPLAGIGQIDCEAACPEPYLRPADLTGAEGFLFGLDVVLAGNPAEVKSFGFLLQYDTTLLAFADSVDPGELIPNFLLVDAQENAPGSITCGGFVDPSDPPGIVPGSSGVLVRLYFRVDCAPCLVGQSVDLVATGLLDDLAGTNGCCGTFTLSNCVANGDVNADQTLSPADAQCAMKIFLAGNTVPGACDASGDCEATAADADCSGSVTPGDALAIFERHLGGESPARCFGAGSRRTAGAVAWGVPARSGESLVVPIETVGSAPTAFGIDVRFGPGLRLERVDRGTATSAWVGFGAQAANGRVRLGGFDPAGAGGELARLVFRVEGDAAGGDVEIAATYDVSTAGPARTGVFAARDEAPRVGPVPAVGPVTVVYGVRRDGARVDLRVHDLAGRLVRVLRTGASQAGDQSARWDGRDLSGRPVAAGTYFVSLRVDDRRWTRRVVILR